MRCSIIISLLACLVVVPACSRSKESPVVPAEGRSAADFEPLSIEIFGPTTNGGLENNQFHDIALAQIRTAGGMWPGQEYDQIHGCGAVTLYRQDNNPNNPFKPVFRWLSTNPYGPGDGPFYVTDRDADDDDNDADYRAVACDAAVDVWGGTLAPGLPSLELAVCYQVRRIEGQLNNQDWEIGITVVRWLGDDMLQFWNTPPTERVDVVLADTIASHDELNPDIAYDHTTGDIYVVYSDVQQEVTRVYVKYRRFDRSEHAPGQYEFGGEYLVQDIAPPLEHNGHNPSIDVGYIDFAGGPTWNVVAVAYTAQFKDPDGPGPDTPHIGYHVCATAWPAFAQDRDWPTGFDLMNPNFRYQDAGLPCVDISPNTNADNVGAVTYTQVVGADGFGPITGVFVVGFLGQVGPHFQVTANLQGLGDAMYPSIAINRQVNQGDPIFASVTFLGQTPQSDALRPVATRVQIDTQQNGWSGWVGLNSVAFGNYNISDIPFLNPCVASAIVTANNNRYWAAWCDRTEMEPPPDQVWACWGYADQ